VTVAARALVLVRNAVTRDARVLRTAETLRDAGFEVLVIGVTSTAEPRRRDRIQGQSVIRIDPRGGLARRPARVGLASAGTVAAPPTPRSPRHARARRLAVTAAYYARGLALVRRVRPDLVHANDYNTMWIALGAKLLWGSRVVYDSHELWPDRNGRPEWRRWLLACEAVFVRLADATITASPGYATALAHRYRIDPPTVVRNIPDAEPASATAERAPGQPPLAVYMGGLMPGRGIEVSIRALAAVPELRLALVGPGSATYLSALRELAARCGVAERLELSEPVAPSQVVATAAHASVGLMLIEPVCRSYELTLPNKLFEYALAGVPILASDLPVIGPLVRDHGLGATVAADDVATVAGGLRELIEPERNAAVRARVRQFAAAHPWHADRDVLSGVYADVSRPAEGRRPRDASRAGARADRA
jgi:glycosyltransferase involved in cell wall biosynthesis